ncbi:syntaxin-2 isoform X2 [Esox lucius]|uniref:t-SNARE coiled-coil homology domain-containing protein n=1 Tax=Esox lucius TaxID=8010 RepID=A0A3P8ZWM5_ESOLU|nr:syntaxin-2 isoform X2 [Esox lucius]
MRDRLDDLTKNGNNNPFSLDDGVDVTVDNNSHRDDFFKQVGEVRSLIGKISSQVDEVVTKHTAILSAPNPEQRTKDELEQLTNVIKRNANVVRAKLKAMQDRLPQDENANTASVDQRIQTNQQTNLMRWFVDVMTVYNETQLSFREKCKGRIQRQLEITGKLTTDEELEEILHSENPAIFTCDIISDSHITRQALNEIESRHKDIIRLESSIKELHEMFVDIAMLVETQGEMINSIERNVSSAAEYVGTASVETKKAVRYQKAARRKHVIIAIVMVTLVAVIALIVGLSLGLKPP